MATDIEQCKHDPRTEEKMNFLVVRQDIGKVLLCVSCGRDESAYRNEGAQFCVVMTNSKRNIQYRTTDNTTIERKSEQKLRIMMAKVLYV